MRVCMLSCFDCVWLIVTIWAVAHHAPLLMRFSRQEYWSGMPCSPPGDLLNPGTESASLMSPVLAGGFFTTSTTWEAPVGHIPACKFKKKFKHLTKLWSNHSVLRYEPRGNWNLLLLLLSHFSRVRLFATLWTTACQAPLSMGFSRQEYWNGLPCSPPGDLLNLGIEPTSLMFPALAGRFFTIGAT